ncbi:MAG: acyltransferase [Actinomycetota bacterium]|nr:acyltransferase [Actinomycetota bacterium]
MTATSPSTAGTTGDRRHRPDIEGLRGLAILAVVLYHAGLLSGGYVGVDVFFVLSGFLITGLLWRELEESGTISLVSFYARRARRLLPAAVLVLVVTTIASAYLLSPLRSRAVIADARAAALYVANLHFAAQRSDYLANAAPSPLQHYWSLAVEEQFYLLWPLFVLGSAVWWRRGRGVSATAATVAFVAVGAASLALCIHLTGVSQPSAFFSLATRAWELVAGALVAVTAVHLRRLPRSLAAAVGWGGMAAILWSATQLTTATPFPGVAAVLPVGGTAALLVAGCAAPRRGASLAMSNRVLGYVGRMSYSWYLWHWPALVLPVAVTGRPLSLPVSLALAAASGLLAAITVVVVENPVRFSPRLAARPRRSLVMAAGLSAFAVLVAGLAGSHLPSLVSPHRAEPAAAPPPLAAPPVVATPVAEDLTIRPPAARADDTRLAELARPVTEALARAVAVRQVPSNLDPPLSRAAGDKAAPFVDGCINTYRDARVHRCIYGDTQSSTEVVLFGDSHATQWFPALDGSATTHRWRLESLSKAVCPPAMLSIWSPVLGRAFAECDTWRNAAMERIKSERPALVVIGMARHYDDSYRVTVYGSEWIAGLRRTVEELRADGIGVVVLGPTPHPKFAVPDCLSDHPFDVPACNEPLSAAVSPAGARAERTAVEQAGGRYIDVAPWLCTPGTCPVVVDNLLVYRDDSHLTTSYVRWIAPLLDAVLQESLHLTG